MAYAATSACSIHPSMRKLQFIPSLVEGLDTGIGLFYGLTEVSYKMYVDVNILSLTAAVKPAFTRNGYRNCRVDVWTRSQKHRYSFVKCNTIESRRHSENSVISIIVSTRVTRNALNKCSRRSNRITGLHTNRPIGFKTRGHSTARSRQMDDSRQRSIHRRQIKQIYKTKRRL